MSPAEMVNGAGRIAFADSGKKISQLQVEGILAELSGTKTGGHLTIVDKGVVVVDQDLFGADVLEYFTSTGGRILAAGGVDKSTISEALEGYRNPYLPTVVKD